MSQQATIVCFEHVTIARDCMDTLEKLGFNVIRLAYSTDALLQLPTMKPDYLFTVNFNPYLSRAAEILKIPYIAWIVDTPCYDMYLDDIKNNYTFTFVYDFAVAKRLKERSNGNVFCLPVAINPARQPTATNEYIHDVSFVANLTVSEYAAYIKPVLPSQDVQEFEQLIEQQDNCPSRYLLPTLLTDSHIDIIRKTYSFNKMPFLTEVEKLAYLLGREQSYRERIRYVHTLSDAFTQMAVYGNNEWADNTHTYQGHAEHYQEMPTIFQKSKINLNITRTFVESGLPMRIFDIMAVGGFVVTNDKEDLHHLFTPGKDLVIFRDKQDLLDICHYYLAHEDERLAIATQGQQTVLTHHTYDHRLIAMFQAVQQTLKTQGG